MPSPSHCENAKPVSTSHHIPIILALARHRAITGISLRLEVDSNADPRDPPAFAFALVTGASVVASGRRHKPRRSRARLRNRGMRTGLRCFNHCPSPLPGNRAHRSSSLINLR
jgi:hypothetical protein